MVRVKEQSKEVLGDQIKVDGKVGYYEYGDDDCFTIARVEICTNDIVEIAIGRKTYIGKFLGFNRMIFAMSIETQEGNMIIPYKNLKYIKLLEKRSGNHAQGGAGESP